MNAYDWIIFIINILLTAVSGIGAFNSNKYYKKSKNISILTNLNKASNEIKTIESLLSKILVKSGMNKRGINLKSELVEIGKELDEAYNRLLDASPIDLFKYMDKLQEDNSFDIPKYIGSFITGEVLKNDEINIDEYNKFKGLVHKIKLHLKEKELETGEKLK